MDAFADSINRSFKAAIETLPESLRSSVCDIHSTRCNGVWELRSKDGIPIAKARDVMDWPEAPVCAAPSPTLPKQMHEIANKVFSDRILKYTKFLGENLVTPIMKSIGDLQKESKIDAVLIDEIVECLERVEKLEKGGVDALTKAFGAGGEASMSLDAMVAGAVGRYLAANPPRSVRGALIDREGQLVLTMTDGETQKLGRVVGRDGMSLESRELAYDDETHEIVERWSVGDTTREFRHPAGGIRDRGFWTQGMEVKACETVTQGGSLWIAKRDTKAKPCYENSDDWRIAARKGRDAT